MVSTTKRKNEQDPLWVPCEPLSQGTHQGPTSEGVGAMSNDNKTTAARKASAVEEETSMREESLTDNTAETTREVRRCPRV